MSNAGEPWVIRRLILNIRRNCLVLPPCCSCLSLCHIPQVGLRYLNFVDLEGAYVALVMYTFALVK